MPDGVLTIDQVVSSLKEKGRDDDVNAALATYGSVLDSGGSEEDAMNAVLSRPVYVYAEPEPAKIQLEPKGVEADIAELRRNVSEKKERERVLSEIAKDPMAAPMARGAAQAVVGSQSAARKRKPGVSDPNFTKASMVDDPAIAAAYATPGAQPGVRSASARAGGRISSSASGPISKSALMGEIEGSKKRESAMVSSANAIMGAMKTTHGNIIKEGETITALEAKAAREEAEAMRRGDVAMLDAEAEFHERNIAVRSEVEKLVAQRNEVVAQKMDTKIDPDRHLKSKKGILTIIGAALVGISDIFASLATGKPVRSDIGKMIRDNIDRDIAMQQEEMRKLGEEIDMSNNLLAEMTHKLGDNKLGLSAAQVIISNSVANELAEYARQYEGTSAGAKFRKAAEESRMEFLRLQEKHNESVEKRSLEEAKLRQQAASTRAQVGLGYAQIKSRERSAKESETGTYIHKLMRIPGMRKPSKDNIKKVEDVMAGFEKTDYLMDRVIQFREMMDAGNIITPEMLSALESEANVFLKEWRTEHKKSAEFGANFSEFEQYLQGVPDEIDDVGQHLAVFQSKLEVGRSLTARGVMARGWIPQPQYRDMFSAPVR